MNIQYDLKARIYSNYYFGRQSISWIACSLGRRIISLERRLRVIRIWPPAIGSEEEGTVSEVSKKLVFYLGSFRPQIEYVRSSIAGLEIVRLDSFGSVSAVEIRDSELQHFKAGAEYRVLWKVGRVRRLPFRLRDYIVDESKEVAVVNEYIRLAGDVICPNGPPKTSEFMPSPVRFGSCAVLGTGPSSEFFINEAGSFDVWIGANAIVLDEELWRKKPPYAICMMDPYIFSPIKSLENVRSMLAKILGETGAIFLTTVELFPMVVRHFNSEVTRKCFFIRSTPTDGGLTQWGRSGRTLNIPRFGNVLCDMMLPVASTISNAITLYGCDGRPPTNAGFFPQANRFVKHEKSLGMELAQHYPSAFFINEFSRIDLHTRYIVTRCMRMGAKMKIRMSSWNKGLALLTIVSSF